MWVALSVWALTILMEFTVKEVELCAALHTKNKVQHSTWCRGMVSFTSKVASKVNSGHLPALYIDNVLLIGMWLYHIMIIIYGVYNINPPNDLAHIIVENIYMDWIVCTV